MKYKTPNLTTFIGKDEYGKDLTIDLKSLGHLLVGGSTGSGKSTLSHLIISTLLQNNAPGDLKLILSSNKVTEFSVYDKIPHLLTEVLVDHKKAIMALKWAIKEVSRRLDIFKENSCRNIEEYEGSEHMPSIVIVIDEFADTMQTYPKEMESAVLKVLQIGHIVGIHVVLSTSRPNRKIFTNPIHDAVSARIALQTASSQDSKTLIGINDASLLRGAGDMIFREGQKYPVHAQIQQVSYKEIKSLCKDLRNKYKSESFPEVEIKKQSVDTFGGLYDEDGEDDELYEQAKEVIISIGKASTSILQRKFSIGYARAARLIDMLEEKNIIGPGEGSTPRKVLNESTKS